MRTLEKGGRTVWRGRATRLLAASESGEVVDDDFGPEFGRWFTGLTLISLYDVGGKLESALHDEERV